MSAFPAFRRTAVGAFSLEVDESLTSSITCYADYVNLRSKLIADLISTVGPNEEFKTVSISIPESLSAWMMPQSSKQEEEWLTLMERGGDRYTKDQMIAWQRDNVMVASAPPAAKAAGLIGAPFLWPQLKSVFSANPSKTLSDEALLGKRTDRRKVLAAALGTAVIGGLGFQQHAFADACDCRYRQGACGSACEGPVYCKKNGYYVNVYRTTCVSYCHQQFVACYIGCCVATCWGCSA